MGFKIVRYKISKKKKINILFGVLFKIFVKYLVDLDLVQFWLFLSDRLVSSFRYFWMLGIVNQKLNIIYNNIYCIYQVQMNLFFWCYMCKIFNVCNLLEEEKLWVFKIDLQI